MVKITTIIMCVITLLISIALPIFVLLIYARKNKKQGIVTAWLIGAAGFFVPQIIIRLPILSVLQTQAWFTQFAENNALVYTFCMAFTAGLFELAGRFGAAKLMSKKLTWKRSVAAGLGHGGIEAIYLIGMTYINNLIFIIIINTGQFDTLLNQITNLGIDASQFEMIRTELVSINPAMFLLAAYERILTMITHVALSVIVCYGVSHKKTFICAFLCLGAHTLIDMTSGIALVLPQHIAYPIIYIVLTLFAIISIFILKKMKMDILDYDSALFLS